VTSIGDAAFSGCSGLTSITIPNSVLSIGSSAFSKCSGLTSITIPNSVTNIGDGAFSGCSGLTSVTIPNSVTSIGYMAFSRCSGLTSVTIPNSVTSIGNMAFSYCSGLTTVTIGNSVTSIGDAAFSGCSGLTTVTIGNSVTSIGDAAFSGCSGLTSITIPNSVLSIGSSAFSECSGLTSITIPNSVTSLGESAFWGCSGLISVTIGNSVARIGIDAFSGCNGLTAVYIEDIAQWCEMEFGIREGWDLFGCWANPLSTAHNLYVNDELVTDMTIPAIVTQIMPYTFIGATCLTSVTIPNSVTSIGGGAFYDCSGLTSITIPNSVTSIGVGAFYNCSGLTTITIPNSITNIGLGAFSYCSGLTSVTIPNSVTSIGERTFFYCNGLTSVTIPNSVTSIGAVAFTYCSGLTSITIPNSVTSIGEWAFGNCYGLTDIYANPTTSPTIETNTFNNSYTATLWVPCSTAAAYGSAEGWSNFANIQERYEYSINALSNDEQQGTASITQQPDCNNRGTAIIAATPAEHYHFVSWDDGNTDNPRTVIVTFDSTFTATFAINQHTITVVSANPNYGIVAGGGTYAEGTVITIEAIANEGFEFASWNNENTDNPRQITVTADATYIATFDEVSSVTEYTITVMSANPNRGTVTGGGTYPEGTVITIEAIANEGFVFASWSDENTDNPRQITVTADATYIATFDEVSSVTEYTITVMSANPNRGTVTGGGTYPEGTVITIEAIANEGFEFASWSDENTDNPRQITVTADATYIASFIPATGIEENASLEIALFPNPATDILNITSSETISEIEIVNVMGQVVRRIEVNSDNAVCDVEDLTSGVYMVRIRTASATLSQRKFIKE
ncbi:MAG: leucine-rich repeat domain-containing protein, partial [Bacteroidales bacterium]|nr:leucine-rich repeat domain-containing protein [Bacteroidales bacterium]